ncbi:MAG: 30S ribosomal protein S6e [Candidatus Heimdallarchaeota archaeon]|nr:30S ribosomal protein S6e [Candidatus Heimdallarchaeota archaeon]MCK5048239.1 30S ribosomal protein S6e [Candidatus Heimdallarchaeota archaeon]
MVNIFLNIANPEQKPRGVCHKKILEEEDTKILYGKKIGETIEGDSIGMPGFKLIITGGSDADGFPMRRDVEGRLRKRILITPSTGYRSRRKRGTKERRDKTRITKVLRTKGIRRRRMVRGNTINEDTAQLNLKIVEYGDQSIIEAL